MCRMRAAGSGIDHHFGVAVVSRDEHGAAFASNCRFDTTEAFIHSFDSFNCRLDLSLVADHVGISKVHDDYVECAIFNCFDYSIGNSLGAHFRLQIISGHFR